MFVRENIFKDVLHLVDEKTLTDMGVTKAGDKMRMLAAIEEIKLKKGERSVVPLSAPVETRNTPPGRMRPQRRSAAMVPIAIPEIDDGEIKRKLSMLDVNNRWLKYTMLEFTEVREVRR